MCRALGVNLEAPRTPPFHPRLLNFAPPQLRLHPHTASVLMFTFALLLYKTGCTRHRSHPFIHSSLPALASRRCCDLLSALSFELAMAPASGKHVPVIDLQGSHGDRRAVVVQQLQALIEWGGFQVINHGVPPALMQSMRQVAEEFFALPVEEKWRYSATTPTNTVDLFHGYGTKEFGTKGALDRGDQLRHKTWPLSARVHEQWPTNPASFRETEEEFVKEQDKLSKHLLQLISESLGLNPSYLNDFFTEDYQQTFLLNHYPPSPEPHTMVGLQKHSDFSGLTILMQDVAGLQLNNDGDWVTAEPIADAFVCNLGDQIEILTNGLYKSPEHRALLNPDADRFSIGCFNSPPEDRMVAPIPELLSESNPLRYKARTYAQYRTEIMTVPFMAKTLTADA